MCHLCNPKFHYRMYDSPPLHPTLQKSHHEPHKSTLHPQTLLLYDTSSHQILGVPRGELPVVFFGLKYTFHMRFHIYNACCMSCWLHRSWFDGPNSIAWRAETMKLLTLRVLYALVTALCFGKKKVCVCVCVCVYIYIYIYTHIYIYIPLLQRNITHCCAGHLFSATTFRAYLSNIWYHTRFEEYKRRYFHLRSSQERHFYCWQHGSGKWSETSSATKWIRIVCEREVSRVRRRDPGHTSAYLRPQKCEQQGQLLCCELWTSAGS